MIIALPNDGRGLLYHVINLLGHTVHAYRDFDTAWRAIEGDQRLAIHHEASARWIGDPPGPSKEYTL